MAIGKKVMLNNQCFYFEAKVEFYKTYLERYLRILYLLPYT